MSEIVLLGKGLDESVMQRALLEAVGDVLSRAFQAAAGPIRERLGLAAAQLIQDSPTYRSLLGGVLFHQLGVLDAASVLARVLSNIAVGVQVRSRPFRVQGSGLEGGLTIEVLKGDYSEVLGVSGGSYRSEGGYEIDWLRWLTLEGDRILVSDHRFDARPSRRSRTGFGLMSRPGRWQMPAEFSGDAADNWLTRALAGLPALATAIIEEEVGRRL